MDEAYPSREERLRAVTDKLEAGVSELFEGGRFADYLRTMSRFHRYSFGNILLIAMQFPGASQVAGFHDWKKKFERNVKKGEKGIKILAPCSFRGTVEWPKLDPVTRQPIMDADGNPVMERKPAGPSRFTVVTVFDVSQTEGKELPTIVSDLTGPVKQYEHIIGALGKLSPVPIVFEDIPSPTAKGYFSNAEGRIVVRPGMSEAQTLKTMIHEVAHAKLHAEPVEAALSPDANKKDRHTKEVEAESVAYVVCQHFGVDTSDYTFGYVAGWSKGKELAELKASLDTIRATAAELIDGIEGNSRGLDPPRQAPSMCRRSKPNRKTAPSR